MRFTRDLPAWLGPDGYPRSWWHYQFGLKRLDQLRAAWKLDVMDATTMSQCTDREQRKEWAAEHSTLAGW